MKHLYLNVCDEDPKLGSKGVLIKKGTSFETHTRLVGAANWGEDWIDVAQANSVRPSTARTWIARESASFKARAAQKVKADNSNMANTMVTYLLNELSLELM